MALPLASVDLRCRIGEEEEDEEAEEGGTERRVTGIGKDIEELGGVGELYGSMLGNQKIGEDKKCD